MGAIICKYLCSKTFFQNAKMPTGGPLDMRIQVMRILFMRLFKEFSKNSACAIFQSIYSTYTEFIIWFLAAAKIKILV